MSKYIDTNKLIAEIESRMEDCKLPNGKFPTTTNVVRYEELSCLRNFIDSLQQEQPIQVNTLTWKDINDLERIINNVHYEFRNGIGEKSFGEEVLERFMEERDEQEQPEVDLDENTMKKEFRMIDSACLLFNYDKLSREQLIARRFYQLGLKARKKD